MLRDLEDNSVLLEIDITRSLSYDLHKMSGVYRGLLWGAATGRIAGLVGSPPCRGERDVQLVLKQMWLTTVAKAARSTQGGFPLFTMLEGRKFFETIKGKDGRCWDPLRGMWPAFLWSRCA